MYIVLGNNYTECYNATEVQKKQRYLHFDPDGTSVISPVWTIDFFHC